MFKPTETEAKSIERLQPAMCRRWLLYFADGTVFDIIFVKPVDAKEAADWEASANGSATFLRAEPVQTWLQ